MPMHGVFAERAEKAGQRREMADLDLVDWLRTIAGKPSADAPAAAAPAFNTVLLFVMAISLL